MACACLFMFATACSNKTQEEQGNNSALEKVEKKLDELISLSNQYKTAKDNNDEVKMQDLVRKGSELYKEVQVLAKDISENDQKKFIEANKSKYTYTEDVAYFYGAIRAYEDNTSISYFEKQGDGYFFKFENGNNLKINP